MKVSACLITLNEELNIEECLESVSWADEIVIVDAESSDATLEKARRFTSKIHTRAFADFASQKNSAIEQAAGDWIFFIDADERVTPGLREEIKNITSMNRKDAVYSVRRETYFFGGRLRFSGTQDDYPIRLFPRGLARFEQPVHEEVVTSLPIKKLRASLLHYTTRNFAQYRKKLEQYTRLERRVIEKRDKKPGLWDAFLRPPAVFFKLYVVKLGFLDGVQGFQFAALSAYYTYFKYKRQSR